jgi:hypothetical protein
MKALSIRQPWAWLIVNGGKDIENRDWYTGFRGRFLIHASKGMTRDEYASAVDDALGIDDRIDIPAFDALERGGIIGSANLVSVVSNSPSLWFCGRYGFELRDVLPCEFRPYKGALGFFEVPDADVGVR